MIEVLARVVSLLLPCALLTFGVTAAACALGFAIERSVWGASRRISARSLEPGQLRWELLATTRFCALSTVAFAAVLAAGALGPLQESWPSAAYSFFVLLVGFDAYYYLLHRALHHPWLVRYHRWHHRSRVTSPLTGFSMGWVESLAWVVGWVGVARLAALCHPMNLAGLGGYLAYLFTGNVLGHTNVEWFPRIAGSRRATWGLHPVVYHSLHHARYDKHFSFVFTAFDRLSGTEYEDWPRVFARVLQGRPLESFQAREEGTK